MIQVMMFFFARAMGGANTQSTLYGSSVNFEFDSHVEFLDIVSINMENGNGTKVTTLEGFYFGNIGMDYGSSAIDTTNHIFYLVNNAYIPVVLSADLANSVTLVPLQFNGRYISCLTVRPSTSEVFAFLNVEQSTNLWSMFTFSYPLESVYEMSLPPSYNNFFAGTFDNDDMLMVLATSNDSVDTDILFIDPNTGSVKNRRPVVNCAGVSIQNLDYDSSDNMLYGGAEDPTTYYIYYLVKVDPNTGNCNATMLQNQSQEVITSWAYDPNERNVWYTEATDIGVVLRAINIDTNNFVYEFLSQNHFSDIEIDPNP